MIKIAITGNICSGKSFVLNRIKNIGFLTFSSDTIIKDKIYKKQKVKYSILRHFPEVLNENGQINREVLGQIIFTNKKKREILESIVYPQLNLVRKKFIYKSYLLGARKIFFEVPLLFEKNLQKEFDKILLVTCSKRIQRIRALRRSNINKEKLNNILKTQISDLMKVRKVDYIINTDLDKFTTCSKIKLLLNKYI